MAIAKAVTSEIAEFNFEALLQEVAQIKKIIIDAGVHLEDDFVRSQSEKIGKNFVDQVKQNLAARFSDQVSDLSELHKILAEKPLQPDFTSLANTLKVSEAELNSEWKFLQRLPGDLSSQDEMIALAVDTGKLSMFPVLAKAIRHLLLLPVGTATVERSFSTLNRILCSKRCRLHCAHARQLMLISIEGLQVPDVRDATCAEKEQMDLFIKKAYSFWLKKPRRT